MWLIWQIYRSYGLLGLIPAITNAGFGLTHPSEMYVLALWYGIIMGGLGGYCRSLFGELLPAGHEAAFFALYSVTDKGSSIFGPTIVGMITDTWGDIRHSFWFMLVLLLIPMPILFCVDVERGRKAADDFTVADVSPSILQGEVEDSVLPEPQSNL